MMILDIENDLTSAHTAVSDAQSGLVERLILVEIIAVACSKLVSVQVLLCFPGGAIPQLRVHGITGGVSRQGCLLEGQLGSLLEIGRWLTRSELRLRVHGWLGVGDARSGLEIVQWLDVGMSVHQGGLTVLVRSGMKGVIGAWDQILVKTGR